MGVEATKDGIIFYGGNWSFGTQCEDFTLLIGRELGWVKWLKNGADKVLPFMQLLLYYVVLAENFTG